MKKLILIFTLTIVFSAQAFAQTNSADSGELPRREWSEAESDGCTRFPSGNYRDCCVAHDREYFAGGSWKERWRSDKKLFECVWAKPKFYNKLVAPVIWLGVRAFGGSWLNASFSWGFGKRKKYAGNIPPPSNRKAKKKKPQN